MREKIDDLQDTQPARARPGAIPRRTYWPFIMAVSVLFAALGLITTWLFALAGLTGFFIALWGWIKEMIHERKTV